MDWGKIPVWSYVSYSGACIYIKDYSLHCTYDIWYRMGIPYMYDINTPTIHQNTHLPYTPTLPPSCWWGNIYHSQLVNQIQELCPIKTFCKHICELVCGLYKWCTYVPLLEMIFDEVTVHLHMFGSVMLHGIMCNAYCCLSATVVS